MDTKKKISCIIVHEDRDIRHLLESYISRFSFLEFNGGFDNAGDVIAFLNVRKADIIFSDIDMSVQPGVRLAEALPRTQQFVFLSSHGKYALTSFRFNTVDYLLEPVSEQRFGLTAEKIRLNHARETCGESNKAHMLVKSNGQVVRINFEDIIYIKGHREYVGIQLRNQRILVYKRMKEMEKLLPDNFKRVHLSFIINTDHLSRVISNHVVTAGENIPIGSSYRPVFLRYLGASVI